MDNEMAVSEAKANETDAPGRGLPKGTPFLSTSAKEDVVTPDLGERTGVFRQLVSDDTDIAGLVAYSIYKQNKLDWLTAFEQAKSRAPTSDELASYIIGEGTPRRLATYRHLAEATLAGNGPEIGSGAGKGARTAVRRGGSLAEKSAMSPGLIVLYALVAVLFIVGFVLAAHYTLSSR